MFDVDFLADFNLKLRYHLKELFMVDKKIICLFMGNEYNYYIEDTCSDCHLWIPLSDRIRYEQKVRMDRMKKEPKPYLIVKKM